MKGFTSDAGEARSGRALGRVVDEPEHDVHETTTAPTASTTTA
jgi:hypothetical protein